MTHPLVQLLEALVRAQKAAGAAPQPSARTSAAGEAVTSDRPWTTFDQGRLFASLFEESQRIHWALLRLFIEPHVRAQTTQKANGDAKSKSTEGSRSSRRRESDDALIDLLSQLQLWMLQYPVAAQAMFSSLVAEGRHFARTPAGARWAQALAESDLIRKGRLVWEATTLNLLEERKGAVLPSTYLEVLRKAAAMHDFEGLLSQLRQGRAEEQ